MEHGYLVVVIRSVACIVIHQLSHPPRERKSEQVNKKRMYKLRKLFAHYRSVESQD
jgi:hypothetical protein